MLIKAFISVAAVVVMLLAGWILLGAPHPDDHDEE